MYKQAVTLLTALLVLFCTSQGRADQSVLTITGLVKRPLSLTAADLANFQSNSVRISDIKKGGAFHGVFTTQGVPLKNLLELAMVEKEQSAYNRPLDLAIVVRNKDGKKVTLSWGEVFYRNPADITVAHSATPVMPHKMNCASCHSPGFTKPYLEQLTRPVGLPKLVLAKDFDADRSLENIVNIELVSIEPKGPAKKKGELFAPRLSVTGLSEHPVTIFSLENLPRTTVTVNVVGDGRGFHGRHVYSGVPLLELLRTVGKDPDLHSVVVVSAPDGYRSLVSWGELLLSPQGQRILIADEIDGNPIEKGGKFMLIIPDDLAADRDVQAAAKIEIHTFDDAAKIYLIGMGPGDTNLVTQLALSRLGRTDAIVAPKELYDIHASYLTGKPLLFDSMELIHKNIYAKAHPEISRDKLDEAFATARKDAARHIRQELTAGRSVAFLDWGDPLIYGSSRWIRSFFAEEEIETVASLSAFNVANAVLGKDVTCKGSVILTVPKALQKNGALLKAAADNGDTLAIFIGLREFENLLPLFQQYYSAETPVAFVYNAGISNSEQVITGTLANIPGKIGKGKEDQLGMIYIGPCLTVTSGECH
jgi:precorrin-4 methylase/DMSO/TMAO reductase YedYZ molybdopterin-dependent catalytic subunit